MAPYAQKKSLNIGGVLSGFSQANKKKAQSKNSIVNRITQGITTTGSIPSLVASPVRSQPQAMMSQERPITNSRTLPTGQPIIAGNIAPQQLQTQKTDNSLNDLVGDMNNVVSEGRQPDIAKLKQLYPEYANIEDSVLQSLTDDIGNVVREGRTVDMERLKQLYPELGTQVAQAQPSKPNTIQNIASGLSTSLLKVGRVAATPIQFLGEKLGQGIDKVAGTEFQKDFPFQIAGQGQVDRAPVTNDQIRSSFAGDPNSFAQKAGEFVGDVGISGIATAATAGAAGSALGGTTLATQAAAIASKYPKLAGIAKAIGAGATETQAFNLQNEGSLATAKETAIGGALGGGLKIAGMVIGGTNKWLQQLRIDKKTKTALKTTTPTELANYITITEKAIEDISMPTAYEAAANKTDDAINIIRSKLDDVGSKIGAVRGEEAKIIGSIDGIVNKLDETLNKYVKGGVNNKLEFINKGKVAILAGDEKAFIDNYLTQLKAIKETPTTQDLVDLNSFLNANINKIDRGSNQFKAIFAEMRGATNSIMDDLLPKEYRPLMVEYKNITNTLEDIDRVYGKSGERGSTMIRNMFGSNSAKTRDILTKIKEITGVDLYKEGQIARFVMDAMDEKRGLEQMLGNVPTSILGVIGNVAKKGLDVVSNPIKGAKSMIKTKTASNTSNILGSIRSKASGVAASKTQPQQ